MNRVKYKLDLLKMEAAGFTKAEIVDGLAKEYHVSRKLGYYYFKTRGQWQNELLGLDDAEDNYLKILNRLEGIYRHFSNTYMQAPDDCNKIGALKGMLETVSREAEIMPMPIRAQIEKEALEQVVHAKMLTAFTPEEQDILARAVRIYQEKREYLAKQAPETT